MPGTLAALGTWPHVRAGADRATDRATPWAHDRGWSLAPMQVHTRGGLARAQDKVYALGSATRRVGHTCDEVARHVALS